MYNFLFKNKKILNNKISKKNTFLGGFTLVEMMVATSIFITIMLVAIGSLASSNATSKRAQQLRVSMDNVNFAMESITRSIRMGTNYICTPSVDLSNATQLPIDCDFTTAGGQFIAFKPAGNMNPTGSPLMAFQQHSNGSYSSLQRCVAGSGCVDITSPEVDISMLKFFVIGADLTTHPKVQPSVYIIIQGTVTIKGQATSFSIQTLASQRSSE